MKEGKTVKLRRLQAVLGSCICGRMEAAFMDQR
jgi:hypothetical protein